MIPNFFYLRELQKIKEAAALKANADAIKALKYQKPAQTVVLPRGLFKDV